MKRSFIDARVGTMLTLCERCGVRLPPFALWGEAEFRANGDAARLIAARGLGWNVVEFRPGAFTTHGLTLFTLRMGDWTGLASGRGRLYAEKAIMSEDGQRAPHHYHVVKTEDIVNRGGARFVVELFKVDRNGEPLKERFRALKDVTVLDLCPGDRVRLEPGESLTLEPHVAHAFWAEGGAAIAGEVSLANDDRADNYFLPPLGPASPIARFSLILPGNRENRGETAVSEPGFAGKSTLITISWVKVGSAREQDDNRQVISL